MLLRSCFSVKGRIRFLSHLDILKVIERAMRRTQIPVAFSQGFNPHPKIAFGTARPVGLSSENEYFDIELDQEIDTEEFRVRLQEMCPEGIIIKEVKEIPLGKPALMAVINCASYQATIRIPEDLRPEDLDQKIAELFSREQVVVERFSPKGRKEYDIRPGIYGLTPCFCPPGKVLFEMDLGMGNRGNVRPEEVIAALKLNDYEILDIVRMGLYVRNEAGEKSRPI